MRCRTILLSIGALSALLLASASASSAQGPAAQCGALVTQNLRLTQDLSCSGDGLIVGADGITINLGGHTLEGVGAGHGVDNSGGYHGVTVRNGAIRGFDVGVALAGAERDRLVDLTLNRGRPSGIGITLDGSDANRIVRVAVAGGDPALRLSGSDFNRILDSDFDGGVAMRVGNDIELRDGADANRIAGSYMHGVADGFSIFDSDGNVIVGSVTRTFSGNRIVRGERNRIEGNSLTAELSLSDGTRNTVRHNVLLSGNTSGLFLDGDRNRVIGNSIPSGLNSSGVTVRAGWSNLVEDNLIRPGFADGIWVHGDAERTRLLGNTASRGGDDGIDVEAPGTILGWNRADDNADLGIEAVEGAIDWGGNRASGNGNPLQCTGVRCG